MENKRIVSISLKYAPHLRKLPNFVGISGYLHKKIVKGKVTDVDCIRIYVSKKVPKEELKPEEIMPSEIEGLPTDLVVVPKPRALSTARWRPTIAGVSETHKDLGACTRSWYVREKETGKILILGCNHCYAKENTAAIGDECLQPSPANGGIYPNDVSGKLYRFVTIDWVNPNRVDVALVEPVIDWKYSIHNINAVRGKKLPELDMRVKKNGRTTSLTRGRISDPSVTVLVDYPISGLDALFEDQIMVRGDNRFVDGGDSGSLLLTEDNYALGLIFAGTTGGLYGIANKIDDVEALTNTETIIPPPPPPIPIWLLLAIIGAAAAIVVVVITVGVPP